MILRDQFKEEMEEIKRALRDYASAESNRFKEWCVFQWHRPVEAKWLLAALVVGIVATIAAFGGIVLKEAAMADWKTIVKTVAPALGAALGGPLVGSAIAAIGSRPTSPITASVRCAISRSPASGPRPSW